MNLTPKYSYRGSVGPDGKIKIEQWDFSTMAGYQIASIIFILIGYAFVGALISPFLAIVAICCFDGKFHFQYILGILVGSYFLYDCAHPGIMIALLDFLLDEELFNYLIVFNVIAVVLQIIFLIFGDLIIDILISFVSKEETRAMIFYCFVGILSSYLSLATFSYLGERKGWLERNTAVSLAKIYENK